MVYYVEFLVPSFPPSNVTVVSISATSVTVNWTYDDIMFNDGYVVYVNDTAVHILNGGDNTTTTLTALMPLTTYSITVRAYQDILGPPSTPLYITIDNFVIPPSTNRGIIVYSLPSLSPNWSGAEAKVCIFIACFYHTNKGLNTTTTATGINPTHTLAATVGGVGGVAMVLLTLLVITSIFNGVMYYRKKRFAFYTLIVTELYKLSLCTYT